MPQSPSKSEVVAPFDPVAIALAEDIGSGDLTSEYFVVNGPAKARIFAKEPAVVAGVEVALEVFRQVDPRLEVRPLVESGARVAKGGSILEIEGSVRSILTGERVALNFLQRLSGVATLTRRFVEGAGKHKARILDTRKTTPGLRRMEKAAVVAGGGVNHRFGLFDMVMVKDNHLLAAGQSGLLQEVIARFRSEHPGIRVELEADTLQQVREFLSIQGVDVILLDNMTTGEMREAVSLGAGRVLFEASGGVTLENIGAIASTGVDFVSIGALTHSARAMDFSLELLP
jgi:nicotinate-nucleotide pyrophosphorylase (carboxylating)